MIENLRRFNNKLTDNELKYINVNSKIELLNDEEGKIYAKLSFPIFDKKSAYLTEVDFYIDNFEIFNKSIETNYSGFIMENKIPYGITFPLRFDENGCYSKITTKIKEMTKEEIEKELGYEIIIKN